MRRILPGRITKEAILLSLLCLCLLWVYSLDRVRLGHSIPDEKRYFQSTREMVANGDYVTPRYHGKLRFQKPIFFYWLILLSYKLFGVGLYGARFPSIVAAILQVIVVYLLGRDIFNKRVGLFAAFILSTCEVFFMYSRFATPDMSFFLFITASLCVFVKAYRSDAPGRFAYLPMYGLMALAMLTKGPLGFIYPMTTIFVFLAVTKQLRRIREINLLPGLILFLAISAPWFIVMIYLHGSDYLDKVWTLEIVKKLKYFTSGEKENFMIHYGKTLLYYAGMVFARHLPWSLFLPASVMVKKTVTPAIEDTQPGTTEVLENRRWPGDGLLFIKTWFFTVLFFLVIVWSKESYYVLALTVPLSLFLGEYFSRFAGEAKLGTSFLFRFPFVLAVVMSFLAVLGWQVTSFYIFGTPIFSPALFMFAIPPLMLYAHIKRKGALIPISFFAASLAFFAYFGGHIMPIVDKDPLFDIAEMINAEIRPGDLVGVASNEVSYHRLNTRIPHYKIRRIDKRNYFDTTAVRDKGRRDKGDFINDFLMLEERRIFCVITKDDYYDYVDRERRDRLFYLGNVFIWKRFDKQDSEYYWKLVSLFFKGKRELFRKSLKEEVYLISNKSE